MIEWSRNNGILHLIQQYQLQFALQRLDIHRNCHWSEENIYTLMHSNFLGSIYCQSFYIKISKESYFIISRTIGSIQASSTLFHIRNNGKYFQLIPLEILIWLILSCFFCYATYRIAQVMIHQKMIWRKNQGRL